MERSYSPELFNVPECLIKRAFQVENSLPDYRTEFMRDRDRIMYSTAYRRLAGKTQIYTVGSDDHKRNRLTHTLEVSQIARTIAIGLRLNEYLTEAIALSHDFGHTPFGHAGEQMLNDIMVPNSNYIKTSPFYKQSYEALESLFGRECEQHKKYLNEAFGFKHNLQSVRVNVCLEDSYRDKENNNIGLNLTNYTLFGMMTHSKKIYAEGDKYPNYQNSFNNLIRQKSKDHLAWSFEAYIVALADEVAQWHHDLEDAIRGGALPLRVICDTIKEVLNDKLTRDDIGKILEIETFARADRRCIANLSHIVVNTLIGDIISNSKKNFELLHEEIDKKKIYTADDFFKYYSDADILKEMEKVISLSNNIKTEKFEGLIKGSVHHSRNVERMNEKGKYIIRKLFEAYYAHPQQLTDGQILHILVDTKQLKNKNGELIYKNIDVAISGGIGKARIDFDELIKNPNIFVKCVLMRRICDHIASMTDHYAIEEYNNLYG